MSRLLRVLVAAVIGLLLGTSSAASAVVAVPHTQIPIYAYDNPHGVIAPTHATTERGPPVVAYDNTSLPSVGDQASRGASARPLPGLTCSYTTYDRRTRFVEGGGARAMTQTAPGGRVVTARVIEGVRCAANTTTRVADDAFEHGYKYHPRIRERGLEDPRAHNFPTM